MKTVKQTYLNIKNRIQIAKTTLLKTNKNHMRTAVWEITLAAKDPKKQGLWVHGCMGPWVYGCMGPRALVTNERTCAPRHTRASRRTCVKQSRVVL